MPLARAYRLLSGVIAAALLITGCAGEPTIQTGEDAETIMGGLARVDNTIANLVYVDPNGEYERYTRAFITPLGVDDIEIIQPRTTTSVVNAYNRERALNDSDKETLRSAFAEAMEREITAGGAFELADGPGDDVIRIEAMITNIAPSGPKGDIASQPAGRSRVYTQGAGGMSIAIMLADGDSGEVLAIVKDTRRSRSNLNWGLNNSVTNMAEVRRNFTAWSKMVHDGLLGLRARAESLAN